MEVLLGSSPRVLRPQSIAEVGNFIQISMIDLRLARLIENHADELARGLVKKIQNSERTSDFRGVPARELEIKVGEIYHHISDWLLTKTDSDIELRFTDVGALRAKEGISFTHLLWAITLTKEHLWGFLQREALVDRAVDLYGELQLLWLLDQFFDRAVYYTTIGYENARLAKAA